MSFYNEGAGLDDTPIHIPSRSNPILVINGPQPESTFWTVVKYLGAGLTLMVGYREAKRLYEKYWGDQAQDEEETDNTKEED